MHCDLRVRNEVNVRTLRPRRDYGALASEMSSMLRIALRQFSPSGHSVPCGSPHVCVGARCVRPDYVQSST